MVSRCVCMYLGVFDNVCNVSAAERMYDSAL